MGGTYGDIAEEAFNAAYGEHSMTQIIPVQGDYAFSDLVKWYDIMDTALVRSGIHPTSGAVMELTNRVFFGLQDENQIAGAQQIVCDNAIHEDAVVFTNA